MDLFRKYLLSSACRSPDEPAAPEPVAADPPAADPPAAVDPPAAEAGDPEPPAPPAEPEHGNKGKSPWYMERISAATQRAQAAEQRAADAEALAQRLQAARPGDPPAVPAPAPQPQYTAADVRQEAARQRLMEDSTTVRDVGLQTFGASFSESLSILTAVGATADDFVLDILAVDKANAHKILDKLAKDPERAAAMANMDSRRRTAELTRMAMTVSAPNDPQPAPKPAIPPKQVSKAPAPPPPVDPSASTVIDGYSDEATEEQFTAQFNERMAKRAARR